MEPSEKSSEIFFFKTAKVEQKTSQENLRTCQAAPETGQVEFVQDFVRFGKILYNGYFHVRYND